MQGRPPIRAGSTVMRVNSTSSTFRAGNVAAGRRVSQFYARLSRDSAAACLRRCGRGNLGGGTPEELAENPRSYTGQVVRPLLARRSASVAWPGAAERAGFRGTTRPSRRIRSELFPGGSVDAGLAQDPSEQVAPDVTLVRIGESNGDGVPDHELVPAPRIRPLEAEPPEVSDQITAPGGSERRHYTTLPIVSVMAPAEGIGRPRYTRSKSHSSRTSPSSSRQASSVAAFA